MPSTHEDPTQPHAVRGDGGHVAFQPSEAGSRLLHVDDEGVKRLVCNLLAAHGGGTCQGCSSYLERAPIRSMACLRFAQGSRLFMWIIRGDRRRSVRTCGHARRAQTGNEGLVVGAVARPSLEKGVDLLLKAMHMLRQRFPKVRLIVAGDLPVRARLEALGRGDGRCIGYASPSGERRRLGDNPVAEDSATCA